MYISEKKTNLRPILLLHCDRAIRIILYVIIRSDSSAEGRTNGHRINTTREEVAYRQVHYKDVGGGPQPLELRAGKKLPENKFIQ